MSLSRPESDPFIFTNVIEELTEMLSERLWHDEAIKDRLAMAAQVDAARAASAELSSILQTEGQQDAFKFINAIEELTKTLSARLWADDTIEDRFVLAALVDGARMAAAKLHQIVEAVEPRYASESEADA
ncbi:hypothetical protein RO575_19610 [Methylomonas sp. MO1]|uniref:hypothetical protein n=1 Tax=unclassified Methylomonas TaxID=2608980 RepID=UPI000478FBF9|nr:MULTISPECIES: hypothetical protein [unclassified Methylomonas]MDT4291777.1 hypothetical protein [Methylomonas sp. MO1]